MQSRPARSLSAEERKSCTQTAGVCVFLCCQGQPLCECVRIAQWGIVQLEIDSHHEGFMADDFCIPFCCSHMSFRWIIDLQVRGGWVWDSREGGND